MKLRVAKWGNSLAIRLPAEFTRAAGLKEGDSVEAQIIQGRRNHPDSNKAVFLKKVRKLRAGMSMTSAAVEAMR